MGELKKLIEKISSKCDTIITLMGITLLGSLIIIYNNPKSKMAMLIACFACGFINITQGLKCMRASKGSSTGISYFMLGIVIIVVGFIIISITI